ncbi:aspartate aminotransferase family protein [Pseudomonas fluorescens]|jgi:4-aminobutyrate aminotransferase-like enzyme|uniref:4-aminobutyrate aminotransferase GabT n=1 Tax=Pseudomonas fluorescens TaxID=294 RepID=A0A5E7Q380_PSEFL|nr:aminotransferase class III-fold pyridoxal phosphate-dependent enzyme [Pseudomonas fluorescens]VVP56205.1 4-aminobutyrate aminotransferase GabT [Pseudomonas fluorescens]
MLKTNAFSQENSHTLSQRTRQMIERRRRLLGPGYQLFYQNPLHLIRGEGVWVYDIDGQRYLDVYNNVPSVGHCHPRVVDALCRQARLLNTHTRYLHDNVLDFAEKLLGTMPAELSQAMFTCTGSEANDLAVRIARDYTGGTGVIITKYAYHGLTASIAELSSSQFPQITPSPDARMVAAPIHKPTNPEEVGRRFAADVRAALADMRQHGIKPAALLLDTFFTSDGGFFEPAGFLREAVDAVREAGGLYIADEVQPGFGRSGRHMWGFQCHDLIPDIVTLGKPMGNGHPTAGLTVKPEILERFASESGYFNTFAGNPVSSAVGLAVLEVIEEENLIANAHESGKFLLDGLKSLAARHSVIGDVRGMGLYAGVDFTSPDGTPDAVIAARVVNCLREEKVLIGAAGPHVNTLKIRPPLVFQREHAEILLNSLERVLERL